MSQSFNFFFSRRTAPCGSCLLNYLHARTHPTSPQRDHDRRMESVWALRRYRAGWLGKRARCRRRKSPTCGLFSATTSSSAHGSLTTLKTQRRDRCALLGGNKHRLIAGNRPAGVGQAVGRWKDASSRWSAGVDNAAPSRPTWGVEGRETTKQH